MARLLGHTTSDEWLPVGVFAELDPLRVEHARLRAQVATSLNDLRELAVRHRREDAAHRERLRQAQRDGNLVAPEDKRTPQDRRAQDRVAIEERLWAGVQVLAEHADRVIATVRAHEDNWLADLRVRLAPAQEKRRRAAALLAEAKAEELHLYKLGDWIQATADDGPFGRQPAPNVEGVPERLAREVFADSLQRPWHKTKPWNVTTVPARASA